MTLWHYLLKVQPGYNVGEDFSFLSFSDNWKCYKNPSGHKSHGHFSFKTPDSMCVLFYMYEMWYNNRSIPSTETIYYFKDRSSARLLGYGGANRLKDNHILTIFRPFE